MKSKLSIAIALMAILALGSLGTACQPLPVAAQTTLSLGDVPLRAELRWTGRYERDIQPIFNQFCVSCHGSSLAANGLRLDSYERVMKGTQYGRVVIPGEPGGSTLLRTLYIIPEPQTHMPHGNLKLSPNRIQNIALWIEAGALRD